MTAPDYIIEELEKTNKVLKQLLEIAIYNMTGEDFDSMYNQFIEEQNVTDEEDLDFLDDLLDELMEEEYHDSYL